MLRHRPWSSAPSLALALLLGPGLTGCTGDEPAPQKIETPAEHAAAGAGTPDPTPADSTPKATTPTPLSEEDRALLAADPKDLTPEQRRARAYARRRQIMQNPDSPVARALQDLADAHQAGEIDATPRKGVWFSLPGTKPTHGRPPAGWRPPDESGEAAPTASNTEETSPAPAEPSTPTPAPAIPNAASTP
ncbi:MAG: hypothetical protein AAGF11_42510 [Myxococcota bacterium]